MRTAALSLLGGVFMLPLAASPVLAHGAMIEGSVVPAIAVRAAYDTGEPMARGQVSVFAPSDPARPRLTGVSDDDGRFSFVPDPGEEGVWAVQVRQAGHGAIVHVRVDAAGAEAGPSPATTAGADPLQRAIMAGAVVWGFIGTALFFWRGRRGHAHS